MSSVLLPTRAIARLTDLRDINNGLRHEPSPCTQPRPPRTIAVPARGARRGVFKA